MGKRLINPEVQAELTKRRSMYALEKLSQKQVHIDTVDEKKIVIIHRNKKIVLYPFTGWFTGKTIKDGRGIENLLSQLK